MARRRKSSIPGLSFSWKRALGVTKAKRSFARATGIPTTKSGRQRKIGRMMTGGCLMQITNLIIISMMIITVIGILIVCV